MQKFNLTLGYSFFEHFYMPYSTEYGAAMDRINQHKVSLSEKLVSYYRACAKKKGVESMLENFLAGIMNDSNKCALVCDYGKDEIAEELIEVARNNLPLKILLAEKNEVRKAQGVNLYSIDKIDGKNRCLLELYSVPVVNRWIQAGEDVTRYTKWLGRWINNERRVVIEDPYIFNDGMAVFKKFYLPLFKPGMDIEVHVDKCFDTSLLSLFNDSLFDNYQISVFECRRLHDRVLFFDRFEIVIGRGIDFLRADGKTEETFVTISTVTRDPEEDIIKKLL